MLPELVNSALNASQLIARAFVDLKHPLGEAVSHDLGRGDGKWHHQNGSWRKIYGIELRDLAASAATKFDVECSIRESAAAHGFGLMEWPDRSRPDCASILLPIYGASGGFGGSSIFYLTAPDHGSAI